MFAVMVCLTEHFAFTCRVALGGVSFPLHIATHQQKNFVRHTCQTLHGATEALVEVMVTGQGSRKLEL